MARDIQAKIPDQFDLPLLKKEIGMPSPTQVVLLQELERWNRVLQVGRTRRSTAHAAAPARLSSAAPQRPCCQRAGWLACVWSLRLSALMLSHLLSRLLTFFFFFFFFFFLQRSLP